MVRDQPEYSWLSWDGTGVSLTLRVIPRARVNQVVGPHGDALKIRLCAPPVEGSANKALIGLLARRLGVRRRQVTIEAGVRGRHKVVHIAGVGPTEVLRGLLKGSAN
jgi:uncharacterized protein (TIGR00251 family)